jgi:superfamily II DNA or RNA helicase
MTKSELEFFKQFTDPIQCKNQIHNYALKKHIEMGQRSSLFMSPGSGKTRVGIIAACEVIKKYGGRALVSVPTDNLLEQWNDEAVKWKYSKEWKSVDLICHASNAKVDIGSYTIIIMDECHLCCGSEVHGYIINHIHLFPQVKFLCLTGTKPEKHKLENLLKVAPEAFELTLNEAVELKLVSEYTINVIDVALSGEEMMKYKKTQQSFIYYSNLLGKFDAFSKATQFLKKDSGASPIEKRNATMLLTAVRIRGSITQNAKRKLTIAKELIDLFPEHYTITFSETNSFTTELHKLCGKRAVLFHSKLSKKARELALKLFADRRTKETVVNSTRALTAGYNVPVINMGIVTAFTSKLHTMLQRLTRACRYIEGKRAILFILVVPNTQEEQWLKNALKDVSNVRYFDSFETYKSLL